MNDGNNVNIQDTIRSVSENFSSVLESGGIRISPDTLLILLIILCLYKNESDLKLILALGYILI